METTVADFACVTFVSFPDKFSRCLLCRAGYLLTPFFVWIFSPESKTGSGKSFSCVTRRRHEAKSDTLPEMLVIFAEPPDPVMCVQTTKGAEFDLVLVWTDPRWVTAVARGRKCSLEGKCWKWRSWRKRRRWEMHGEKSRSHKSFDVLWNVAYPLMQSCKRCHKGEIFSSPFIACKRQKGANFTEENAVDRVALCCE